MVTTLTRRHFAKLRAASALACPAVGQAQPAWPTKPVRILISFPPGGSSDYVARVIAPALSEHFGQQFVVDNRPGAGGTVAGDILRREQPDGYTFLPVSYTHLDVYKRQANSIIRPAAPKPTCQP